MASLSNGLARVVSQPFGAGVGSTGSASLYDGTSSNDFIIENYYFFVAHESGYAGLVVFLALFGTILWQLYVRRSGWPAAGLLGAGIGLALIGILLPVWVDETVAIVWWGIAGAILASKVGIIEGKHAKRPRKQTTARTT